MILASELKSLATQVNLNLMAVYSRADAELYLAAERPALQNWQEQGFAGEMQYMQRPVSLFTELKHFLPSVKSILIFSVPYSAGRSEEASAPVPPGFGRVARYAWGRDYHRVIKKRLERFSKAFIEKFGITPEQRSFSDAVPLLERTLAKHSAHGFIGKNTLFIRPGSGSYQFLAELLWNVEVENDLIAPTIKSRCGTCTNCLSNCPTNAFVEPYVLDARRCISYLTIEKQGDFSEWEQSAVGQWIFGCDVCQDVCPFNHEQDQIEEQDFSAERGAGAHLDLISILRIRSPEEFLKRFAGTPIMRAGRESMIRNACAVISNTNFLPAIDALREIQALDASPVAREAARKSLGNLLDPIAPIC